MPSIDLNADIGEGTGTLDIDAPLLEIVTSASIACGGHAGNYASMSRSVSSCLRLGIRIGAHPSYPDVAGFGRASMNMEVGLLVRSILDQVSQLQRVTEAQGGEVVYLKPHGALYHDASLGGACGAGLIKACSILGLGLLCLADAPLEAIAQKAGTRYIREGFADRAYDAPFRLVPRSRTGSLITDPLEAASQASGIAHKVDSICIHSDTPGAVEIAAVVRNRLEEDGWELPR